MTDKRLISGVAKPRRVKLVPTVRINAYPVIAEAVDSGVAYGWHRAHKHTATPSDEAAIEEIAQAVMNELCDVLNFGGDDDAAA